MFVCVGFRQLTSFWAQCCQASMRSSVVYSISFWFGLSVGNFYFSPLLNLQQVKSSYYTSLAEHMQLLLIFEGTCMDIDIWLQARASLKFTIPGLGPLLVMQPRQHTFFFWWFQLIGVGPKSQENLAFPLPVIQTCLRPPLLKYIGYSQNSVSTKWKMSELHLCLYRCKFSSTFIFSDIPETLWTLRK